MQWETKSLTKPEWQGKVAFLLSSGAGSQPGTPSSLPSPLAWCTTSAAPVQQEHLWVSVWV